jgi:hypothetical protein
MSRAAVAAFVLIGTLGMLGFECGAPRPPRIGARVAASHPGSCDGFIDYGDEFRVLDLQIGWMTPVAPGLVEAEIRILIQNVGDAPFRGASAVPNLVDAQDLGVVENPAPLPADFGALDPGASAWSTNPLLVQLPPLAFDDLMARLRDGTVPLVVHADEVNVLAPGVEVHDWSSFEDRMYYLASQPSGGFGGPINADPGPGPFLPGQEFGVGFLEFTDDAPSVFDDYEEDDVFYLVENPDATVGHENVNIPDAFDQVRVVGAERQDDEDDGFTLWFVTLKRTDTESLPDMYATASFCTGTGTHVDPQVQRTRIFSLDGDVVDDVTRESNEQPIRANGLTLSEGAVTFSGQISGHVLKPSLSLRLRHGHVEAGAEFDTSLTFAAELRAEEVATLDPERAVLWQHCFPMPSLPAGPVTIPMSLQLRHDLGMQGSIGAGALVGFEKHWDSGFSILCQGGPGVPEDCTSEGHRIPTPIQWTPPQFTESTGYELRVDTELSALLRLGSAHPECETGPGLSLDTTAYMRTGVSPADDPWWSAGYGLEVTAALDLDLLGLDVARYETQLYATEEEAADSNTSPPSSSGASGARTSGQDQRWAVAIDETTVPNGVSHTDIAVLPDGSSLAISTEAVGGRNPLVKLDRFGALAWVKKFAKKVKHVYALPDGTAVAAGSNSWIARFDADGNLLWSFDAELGRADYAFARCVLADVAPIEIAPGIYDYVGVGTAGTNLVTTSDACAFRVRHDGTLAWSRIYVGERGQGFSAALATRSGGEVVAVGSTSWYYVGNRSSGLIVKLDADNGDIVWSKSLPMLRLAGLGGVTQGADGTIYAVGNAQGIIYSTGAAVVARIAPDGSDARHALLFQDEDWEAFQDDGWNGIFDFEPFIDTAGGDTAYDTMFDIAPSGDGFVVAGHTGLGASTAGRVAKINANLGVDWFTTFDGPAGEALNAVAVAADGIFVSGQSASLPEADGGSGENQLWLMKLPFSGSLELLPDVAMTARYVSPGVRYSSVDPGVNPLTEAAIDAEFTYEDVLPISMGPNAAILGPPTNYCVKLLTGTGSITTTDSCPD